MSHDKLGQPFPTYDDAPAHAESSAVPGTESSGGREPSNAVRRTHTDELPERTLNKAVESGKPGEFKQGTCDVCGTRSALLTRYKDDSARIDTWVCQLTLPCLTRYVAHVDWPTGETLLRHIVRLALGRQAYLDHCTRCGDMVYTQTDYVAQVAQRGGTRYRHLGCFLQDAVTAIHNMV